MRAPLRLGDADAPQHLDGLAPWPRAARSPWCRAIGLGDLLADREERVQRGHRLLEDHRDVVAADRLHLGSVSAEQVAAVEADRAADDAARRVGDQAQDRQRGHALAAAGFADDAQRLAGAQREGHAVDGRAPAPTGREEIGLQVLDLEHGRGRRRRRRAASPAPVGRHDPIHGDFLPRRRVACFATVPDDRATNAIDERRCRGKQSPESRPTGRKQAWTGQSASRAGVTRRQVLEAGAAARPRRLRAAARRPAPQRRSRWSSTARKFQLAAPEPNPKRGGVLRYAITSRPPHFDVHQSGTINSLGAQGCMFDNLVRRDPRDSGKTIIPDLAHSWQICQGRQDLHLLPARGRAVPRRRRADGRGRQGDLRPHRQAAAGRLHPAQRAVRGGRARSTPATSTPRVQAAPSRARRTS